MGDRRIALAALTMALYWPLSTIAALMAALDLAIRQHYWAKTEWPVRAEFQSGMNLTDTLIVLAIVGAVFALASWRGMRPADPLKPRLLPWRAIIIASGAFAIFLLVHLLTMLGLKADRPAPY